MKAYMYSLLALIFLGLVGCGDSAETENTASQPKALQHDNQAVNIAVMATNDFVPDMATSAGKIGLPEPLVARIMERLTASKRFSVLERTALRRAVNEQRFGAEEGASDLDRVLDKAVSDMENVTGGALYVSGGLAIHNDLKKDFQNLGSTLGADYIVYAKLESVKNSTQSIAIPHSESGKSIQFQKVKARLYLRVIDVAQGRVSGAASVDTELSQAYLKGINAPDNDALAIYDHVSQEAFAKILDIIFPARIVNVNPLVINRGNNDGAVVGSVYRVEREGKEITDDAGVSLGRLNSKVGVVSVDEVQETMSIVSLMEGSAQPQDLVILKQAGSSTVKASANSSQLGAKQSGKATLVVGKIKLLGGNNSVLRGDALHKLSNDLIVKLTHTNRFEILERQEVDQVLDEKIFDAVMQGEDVLTRFNELADADYLIHVSIRDFYVKEDAKRIAALNETVTKHFGVVEATLRIVDVHSGKVVAADKININEFLGKLTTTDEEYSALIDHASTTLVAEIVSQVYPVKVLAVVGDTVYLNRGLDGGLKPGQAFAVYRPGEELIDPDTGIQFGRAEAKVAQVTLLDVEQARSTAELSMGKDVKKGDILKPVKSEKNGKTPKRKVNKPKF